MEIDEIEDTIIQQRHEEVTRALESIARAIQTNSVTPIAHIMEMHLAKSDRLISAIKEISTKGNGIDENVVSLLKENTDNLNKTLKELGTSKPKEWVFKIKRDSYGQIDSITATNIK